MRLDQAVATFHLLALSGGPDLRPIVDRLREGIEAFPDADLALLLRAGLQELAPGRDPALVAQVVDAAMAIAQSGWSVVLPQVKH